MNFHANLFSLKATKLKSSVVNQRYNDGHRCTEAQAILLLHMIYGGAAAHHLLIPAYLYDMVRLLIWLLLEGH